MNVVRRQMRLGAGRGCDFLCDLLCLKLAGGWTRHGACY